MSYTYFGGTVLALQIHGSMKRHGTGHDTD
jgi:hypothetical protein